MTLDGKTAIVTGGASGLAEGIVRALAGAGAQVLIADGQMDAAEALATEIGGQAMRVDLTDTSGAAAMAEQAKTLWGGAPDILVNGALVRPLAKGFAEVTEDEFDKGIQRNARALFVTVRALVPGMAKRGSGRVINLCASGGLRPGEGQCWGAAASAWIVAATEGLAQELAPKGLTVNALSAAAGDSQKLPRFMSGAASAPEGIPLGRVTSPQDAGAAAVFLCSDGAALITGAVLPIDGGRSL